MKNTVFAVAASAIMAGIGVSSSWAQLPEIREIPASVVDGQGIYQHFYATDPAGGWELFPSDEEVGQFVIRITPEKGKKAPQVVVNVNGKALRDFWGGPLHIRSDYVKVLGVMWDPNDSKPGQFFVFEVTHPSLGNVFVSVYVHDNEVPGYNDANPQWSDWFGVSIDYDGLPLTGDEMFAGMGIVTNGNIVDYRD